VATCLILAPLCFLGFGFFGPRGCLRNFGRETDRAKLTKISANSTGRNYCLPPPV
jgi:hypothetical protein